MGRYRNPSDSELSNSLDLVFADGRRVIDFRAPVDRSHHGSCAAIVEPTPKPHLCTVKNTLAISLIIVLL